MLKKILIVVVLFFLFVYPAECESPIQQTESIYFYPVADTYVYEKSNAVPLSKLELRVGNQNTISFGNMRSALKFDISAIPENSVIKEASLHVYSIDAKPSWDSRPIQAYSAPNNWSESDINWSLVNDENAKINESSLVAGLAGSSPDTYFWDITTMVQSWVNGEPNFGIILQYDIEKLNDFVTIYSSKNLIFKPYLSVSYTIADPALPVPSLPIKTLKQKNDSEANQQTAAEHIVKTNKAEEPASKASLHPASPSPLADPNASSDTLSNSIQKPPQSVLPEITRHPQSQIKDPGTPVNFLVTASGTPPLLFQWQKDGKDIKGETSKILTIESISEDTEGIFTCSVSNDAGSVISNGAELYVNDNVEIIDQPVSQSVVLGKPVTFSLAASGTGPLSFQWKKDHIIIHGATKDRYTIASVQKNDEGIYTCEVSNDFSNDISNDALLAVINPPQIDQQPQSKVKPPGAPVTFIVKASPPPLSYQWLKDGMPINGETSERYTINSVSENDEGSFTCNVTNDAGSVLSNGAELFVNDAAEILYQPVSHSIVHGKPVTFSLTAAGTSPLSYQWKKDHIIIHGATTDRYTIASVQKKDEGIYTCEVSNDFSNDISNDALLVVITPPQISQQPLSQVKNPGMPVTFSVITSGTPPFSFLWLKDGRAIDGETSESYTIDSVSENDEGSYTCKISNDAGILSSTAAILSVNNPPEISGHPLSRKVNPETSVIFSVTASGTRPLLFQWMKNGIAISNAVTDTYAINSVSEEDEGSFTCTVTNNLGSLTSKPALLSVNDPPEILNQPLSQIINPQTAVSFSVKVSGTPPFSYQWMKDGEAIPNAHSDSYTIDSVLENDEGVFICAVTNDAGSLTSNAAVLTVNDSVEIIKQPLSVSKSAGESVTFSVEASGTKPLAFQWEKNGLDISGATSKSYTITSAQNADGGAYKCRVNNDFSHIISDRADLLLKNSAQIHRHPQSQSKNPGTHVTFSVTATGTPPLFFQWQKDNVDIDGATNEYFTIDSVSKNDKGVYSCTVSNDAGSVRSDNAELFVNDPVQIIKQPLSQSKIIGEPVTFTINAAGSAPLSFQWQKDHMNIPGATEKTYTIGSVQNEDEGEYKCKISNDFSNIVSDSARLNIKISPQINRHPQSQQKNPGASLNFLVTASGTPPLLFQWRKDGVDINGGTSKSFTIPSICENDEGFYSCKVTNEAGSVTSADAELLVNDPVKIKVQPLSQSKKTGEPVIFSITPAGTGPWFFQWKKDHIVIPGATSKTYTIDAATKDDEGIYTCLISNDFSNDISNEAMLVLIIPPQISQQPLSRTINPGAPVTFGVTASGTPPVSYQWMKNGSPITGADTDKYFIASASEKDEGTFTCLITNDSGSLTSHPAVLTVNDPVQIIKQPLSHSKKTGETVTFIIDAAGSLPLSFQWEKDHILIPGATSDHYTITAIQDEDAGVYTCNVYNDFSNIVSENAHLILNDAVQIIQHPRSQLKTPGMPVSFSVSATGKPPLTFQWQKDGVDIDGAASEEFAIESISEKDEGFYSCKVSNDTGSVTSADAELMINFPPRITQQPQSQLIDPGKPVTFSLSVSGMPPLSFQWQKDGVDIDRATSAEYTINSISEKDEGFYLCKVSNDAGSVMSADAELMINAVSAKKTEVAVSPKKSPFVLNNISLKAPPGQGLYIHNGNTLTITGTAFPHATLISACLEDDQNRVIRNVSKVLKINSETGNFNGSVFVGSFRGAETVHLKITIQGPPDSQPVTGKSNILFMDNGYPEVSITEPGNYANFIQSPIVIYGTASDDRSGIAIVEISTNGGATFDRVDTFRNNQWLYSFKPKEHNAEYNIKVRSTDSVGLSTMTDTLTIRYTPASLSRKQIAAPYKKRPLNESHDNSTKSPDEDGICTYRIINLSNNNFQPTDVFTLKEQMAIIVKGYGGQMVTLRIIDPSIGKILFELSDFIPPHKNKMWKWELSQTGKFQAALIVDGNYEDQISFTIIQ